MQIVTVARMRAIEAEAEQQYGLSGPILMQHAGESAAAIAADWLGGSVLGTTWLLLIGPGNNGGDGRVMAGHLAEAGAVVTFFDWKQQTFSMRGEQGEEPLPFAGTPTEHLAALLDEADIVVDALFGIGHSRPLDASIIALNHQIIEARQRRKGLPRIVALDIPSGLNADTGEIDQGAFHADLTITLGAPKIGMFWYPGADFCGEIRTGPIGLPSTLAIDGMAHLATPEAVQAFLPARPGESHKGSFGNALVIAGSPSYPGAALLCSLAAGRSGTGLVTIATTPQLLPAYIAGMPEAVYALLPDIAEERLAVLIEAVQKQQVVIIGPGLGQSDITRAWFLPFLRHLRELPEQERPHVVIDADGLNLLSQQPHWWDDLPAQTIITPHPGEMARLLGNGTRVSGGGADRLALAQRYAREWGTIIVLKGAVTVVASPDGEYQTRPWLNYAPNPAMATAGSGDVLAGTIGGLLAQGAPPFAAAAAGVALHSEAGRQAAQALGGVRAGMLAGDLVQYLPEARAVIER